MVVQFSAQHLFAEFFPVVHRVLQVQMPYLVHHGGRRGPAGQYAAEVHKPFVLGDRFLGEGGCPLLLAGELAGKGVSGRGVVRVEVVDALPQRVFVVFEVFHVVAFFLLTQRCRDAGR
ncbi:hypothetical protein EGT74_18375 [Chitinophaga lutea]|uniref:Uncharacterized protein n=1 Tax=Chitinophaga lutea TaxID=2488634 RepID=A0A3N4PZ65_9BACT|nr:hypothetical protein EGT74_18375 [Chitinophaga lutea]